MLCTTLDDSSGVLDMACNNTGHVLGSTPLSLLIQSSIMLIQHFLLSPPLLSPTILTCDTSSCKRWAKLSQQDDIFGTTNLCTNFMFVIGSTDNNHTVTTHQTLC